MTITASSHSFYCEKLVVAFSGYVDSELGFDLVFIKKLFLNNYFFKKYQLFKSLWPYCLSYSQLSIRYDREFLTFTNTAVKR